MPHCSRRGKSGRSPGNIHTPLPSLAGTRTQNRCENNFLSCRYHNHQIHAPYHQYPHNSPQAHLALEWNKTHLRQKRYKIFTQHCLSSTKLVCIRKAVFPCYEWKSFLANGTVGRHIIIAGADIESAVFAALKGMRQGYIIAVAGKIQRWLL